MSFLAKETRALLLEADLGAVQSKDGVYIYPITCKGRKALRACVNGNLDINGSFFFTTFPTVAKQREWWNQYYQCNVIEVPNAESS